MTETNLGRPLEEASGIAQRFLELVEPNSERIIVAGSIRRKRPWPRDIDIVAIPKFGEVEKDAWFAPIKVKTSLLQARVDELIEKGVVKRRVKSDGKTMVGDLVAFIEFEAMPLDVYYSTEETWWGLVQMRTGSARFNRMLATRALRMGLKYHGDGHGVTRKGVRIDDGSSEDNIFKALDLKYLRPEDRD